MQLLTGPLTLILLPAPLCYSTSPQILIDVSKEVARIEAEEAAARAAEEAAAAALAEAEAAGEAVSSDEDVAHVVDAIKRSPLMMDVPSTTAGLAAVAGLVSSTTRVRSPL
jgi:glucose-6-phosphate isomerase